MVPENFKMASSRGDEELNCYRWMPEGEPVAALQIVHGMTEHILRYSDFAEFLNRRGFAVYGHDHLGHGGTSEEKGFIAEEHGDDMLVADMARVNARMAEDLPGIRRRTFPGSRTSSWGTAWGRSSHAGSSPSTGRTSTGPSSWGPGSRPDTRCRWHSPSPRCSAW